MINKKSLMLVSSVLLVLNLVLAGLALLTYQQSNKTANASGVLGVSTTPTFNKNIVVKTPNRGLELTKLRYPVKIKVGEILE